MPERGAARGLWSPCVASLLLCCLVSPAALPHPVVNIRSNPTSSAIARSLASSQVNASRAAAQLASGVRVQRAADDAAGLAVGEKLRAQIAGNGQAIRNAKDAVSMVQTADGALASVQQILQRIRTLALQAISDTQGRSERAALQREVGQLQQELDRTAQTTAFGGQKLLDGSLVGRRFQIGAQQGQEVSLSIPDTRLAALGVDRVTSARGDNSLTAVRGGLPPNPRVTGTLDTDVPVGSSIEATGTILDALGNDVAVRATYTRLAPTSVTSSSWTVTLRLEEAYTRASSSFGAGTLLAQGTVTFNGARGDTGQTRGNVLTPAPPGGIVGTAAATFIAGRPFGLDLALTQIDDDDGVVNSEVGAVPAGSPLQGGSLSAGLNNLELTTGITIDGVVLDNAGFLARGTTARVGHSRSFQVRDRNGNLTTATLRFERPPVPNDINNDGVPDDVLPAAVPTTTATVTANLDAGAVAFGGAFDPASPVATSHLRGTTTFFDSRGVSHAADVYFRKTADDEWQWHAVVDGASVNGGAAGTNVVVARGALTFDPGTGALLTSTQDNAVRFNPATAGATQNQLVTFQMAGVTQQPSSSTITSIVRNGSPQGDGVIDGVAPDPNLWNVTIRAGVATTGALWAAGSVVFAPDGAGGFTTQTTSLTATTTGRNSLGTTFQIGFPTSAVTAGSGFSSAVPVRNDITVHRPGSIAVTGALDTDMAVGDSRVISGSPPPELRGTDGRLTPLQIRMIRLSSVTNTAQWLMQAENATTGAVLGSQRLTYVATDVNASSLSTTTPTVSLQAGIFRAGTITSFANGNAFTVNVTGLRRLHDVTDPVGPATVLPAPSVIGEPPLSGIGTLAGAATNRMVAQTLTVVGAEGTATAAVAAGQSAAAVAAAVNAVAGTTGVTARGRTVVQLSNVSRTGPFSMLLQGDPTGGQTNAPQAFVLTEITDTANLSALVAAVNQQADVTGIVARLGADASTVLLVAEDGRDIAVGDVSGANLLVQGIGEVPTGTNEDAGSPALLVGDADDPLYAGGTVDSTRVGGTVRFESTRGAFVVRTTDTTSSLVAGTADDSELETLSRIDVATADGAARAIAVVDASIQKVTAARTSLGALQNRLSSTIAQLGDTVVNLQTAHARIVDADVAQKAAELARALIVTDVGGAMLAQANQRARIALKLLG